MLRIKHVLREMAANAAMSIAPVRDWRVRRGRTHGGDTPESVRGFLAESDLYLETVGRDRIAGMTVAEIGPGDAIPLGLVLLGAGAKRYVAVDRFPGDLAGKRSTATCAEVLKLTPPAFRNRLAGLGLFPLEGAWLQRAVARSTIAVVRSPVERLSIDLTGPVDLIVSYNAVEHLLDINEAFRRMAGLLSPDGRMIHRVDYGPHGSWRGYPHPLAFLTVPDILWRLMGSARGYPNRARHSDVMAALSRCGLAGEAAIVSTFAGNDISSIRPRLPARLRMMPDDSLAVKSAVIVSRKAPSEAGLNRPPVAGLRHLT